MEEILVVFKQGQGIIYIIQFIYKYGGDLSSFQARIRNNLYNTVHLQIWRRFE